MSNNNIHQYHKSGISDVIFPVILESEIIVFVPSKDGESISVTANGQQPGPATQPRSSSLLKLCMLGCEPNPPYGPNEHTAKMLLDLIVMAIQKNSECCISTGKTNVYDNKKNDNDKDSDSDSDAMNNSHGNGNGNETKIQSASTSSLKDNNDIENKECMYETITWTVSIDVYDVQKYQYPTNWDKYNGILLPGSFSSAYDVDDWIQHLKDTIQTCIIPKEMKTLAICFGHQIFAHSYYNSNNNSNNNNDNNENNDLGGGKAIATPTGSRVGRYPMNLTKFGKQLFQKDIYSMFVSHSDMVESLPPTAVPIGGCTEVPIQAAAYFTSVDDVTKFMVGRTTKDNTIDDVPKPIAISFQAHPEYSTKLGIQTSFIGCIDAMYERQLITKEHQQTAHQDLKETWVDVQKHSVHAISVVGRILGWFP